MPESRRVIDLVPRQRWVIFALLVAGLAVVAGLEGLYAWMPSVAQHTSDGRVMAFDLDSEGSLAVWFSSTTLLAASLVAWLVYGIRRHQPDDYRGRFGVWRWAALVWLVMSIDEAGSLHEGFKEALAHLTGQRLGGDGSLWWVLGYAPVLGYVGLRLAWDVRRWPGTLFWLAATAGCYAVAVATQLEWIWPQSGARSVMLEEGCEMVGNLTLLVAMLWHARLLVLVSQGQLKPAAGAERPASEEKRRPRKSRVVETAADDDEAKPAPTVPSRPAATVARSEPAVRRPALPEPAPTKGLFSGAGRQLRIDPAEESSGKRPLSKSDRKAIRREMRERARLRDDDDE